MKCSSLTAVVCYYRVTGSSKYNLLRVLHTYLHLNLQSGTIIESNDTNGDGWYKKGDGWYKKDGE